MMKAFKDTAGRQWEIEINVTATKRLKTLLEIDVYQLIDDAARGLGELMQRPDRLVDVLFVLVADQAEKLGVTDEEFGRGFSGDTLEAAGDAFVKELIDFFPNKRARESVRKVLDKSKALADRILERTDAKVDSLELSDAELDQVLDTIATKRQSSPGNSAAASA